MSEALAEIDTTGTDLIARVNSLPDAVRAIGQVVTADDYRRAGEIYTLVKDGLVAVRKKHQAAISASDNAHKEALAVWKREAAPGEEAKELLEEMMRPYLKALEAERAQAERDAREEDARLARERAAEDDRARAAARQAAEDHRLQQALEAERAGDAERARRLVEAPVVVEDIAPTPAPAPVPVSIPAAPKLKGMSVRPVWKWELTNRNAVKPTYLMVDEAKVGRIVRATGPDAADIVGGIRVYDEASFATRRR